jgi:hypothetical protein
MKKRAQAILAVLVIITVDALYITLLGVILNGNI